MVLIRFRCKILSNECYALNNVSPAGLNDKCTCEGSRQLSNQGRDRDKISLLLNTVGLFLSFNFHAEISILTKYIPILEES